MKKIILLSLALLSAVILLNNTNEVAAQGVNQSSTGDSGLLTLDILAGNLSCSYTEDIYVGSGTADFSSFIIAGAYSGIFECTDLYGSDTTWTLTIETSILENQANTGYTIAASGVDFKSSATQTVSGDCNLNNGTTGWTAIDTAQPIMGKLNDEGAVCKLKTITNQIQVHVPAYQAVGQYRSTLTYTLVEA